MNVLRLCFGALFLADTPKSAKIKIIEISYFSHPQAYFLRIEKKGERVFQPLRLQKKGHTNRVRSYTLILTLY